MIELTIILAILSLISGYLFGSIFISYPWGLLKGIDLTKSGTGQLGGSNAGRLLGWYVLPIAGLFDVLKAFVYLYLLNFYCLNYLSEAKSTDVEIALITGSIGLVLGHVYSVYIKLYSKEWHGGKGAASYGGILLFISLIGFFWGFVVLFGILQIMKKVLKTKLTVYDNFFTNSIMLLASPFVIYFFVPKLWITGWLIILILLFGLIEWKKILQIINISQ